MTRSSLARIASLIRIDVLMLLSFVRVACYVNDNSLSILTDTAHFFKRAGDIGALLRHEALLRCRYVRDPRSYGQGE